MRAAVETGAGVAAPRLVDVAGRALATHRGHWMPIAGAALVALVPAAIMQGLLEREALSRSDDPVVFAVLALGGAAVGLLGYFFLAGVIAHVAMARRRGEERENLVSIARHLPWRDLLIVDLVVSAGVVIGLQLLVVPGLVFGTWYGLAAVLVETRRLSPFAALRRSRELARGCFWRVLALLLVPLAVVTGAAYALAEALAAILDAPADLEWGLAALIAGMLFKPFVSVVTVELAIELDEATPDQV